MRGYGPFPFGRLLLFVCSGCDRCGALRKLLANAEQSARRLRDGAIVGSNRRKEQDKSTKPAEYLIHLYSVLVLSSLLITRPLPIKVSGTSALYQLAACSAHSTIRRRACLFPSSQLPGETYPAQ
jgi:hypothetical protein